MPGTITVDGAGSQWNTSSLSLGNTSPGGYGNLAGALNITNGASVSVLGNTTVGLYESPTANCTGTINFANGGTLTTQTLSASPSELAGVGTINAAGIVSDLNVVFDATHGLKQTVPISGVSGQNIALNLDVSNAANNGALARATWERARC